MNTRTEDQIVNVTLERLRERIEALQELPPPAVRAAIRCAAGLTLAEVGDACDGVSRSTVWAWEQGKADPNPEVLPRYLAVLRLMREATSTKEPAS